MHAILSVIQMGFRHRAELQVNLANASQTNDPDTRLREWSHSSKIEAQI